MAWQIVVEMLDLPVKMTPAERLLLVALAERADLHSRECWPDEDELCRRTDLSPDGLGKALRRLAGRGIEVRVPVKQGAAGRGAYSHTGRKRSYRLPRVVTSAHDQVVVPEGDQLARVVVLQSASGRTPGRKVVVPEGDPNRQATVNNRQHAAAEQTVIGATGATGAEAAEIVRRIAAERTGNIRSIAGLVRHLAAAGELPRYLPCARDGERMSEACKRGDGRDCTAGRDRAEYPNWCACRCHPQPGGEP